LPSTILSVALRFAVVVCSFLLVAALVAAETIYEAGDEGVRRPRLIEQVSPEPTDEVRKSKVEARVQLRGIIRPDGRVSDIEVVQGFDEEVDRRTIEALRLWRFHPATKDGNPVSFRSGFSFELKAL